MSPMKIDHDAIRNLANLLTETDLTEIEIAEGDKRIRVTRVISVQAITTPTVMPQMTAANTAAPVAAGKVGAISPENHPGAVKSPMVGTVYLQSDPAAPRFVTKGSVVKPGDTLVIIEAMKVMNPIKADKGGTVVDVLVEDGQPVEFGQAIVIIE